MVRDLWQHYERFKSAQHFQRKFYEQLKRLKWRNIVWVLASNWDYWCNIMQQMPKKEKQKAIFESINNSIKLLWKLFPMDNKEKIGLVSGRVWVQEQGLTTPINLIIIEPIVSPQGQS